jgi:hypothetical protein
MKKDPTKAGAFFISVLIIEDRWKLLCHSNVLCYELFRRFRGLTEIWAGFLAVDGIREQEQVHRQELAGTSLLSRSQGLSMCAERRLGDPTTISTIATEMHS